MNLKQISLEIRDILEHRRTELQLTFEEETHTYTMLDSSIILRSDFLSVSSVIKLFHDEFDTNGKSLAMCRGNVDKQTELLFEWSEAGRIATNTGSRVHYLLEKYIISLYGDYKEVRKPIFDCDDIMENRGNSMVLGGAKFIDLMHSRGAVLLDTEIVLGSPSMEYTGQPDKVWLFEKEGKLYIIISDWKSNKSKNFEVMSYHNRMYDPFGTLWNNSLGHYNIQLPLYAKLLIDMLKGTKYGGIELMGSIIVLLKDDGTFEEFKVPKKINDTVLSMVILTHIKRGSEL